MYVVIDDTTGATVLCCFLHGLFCAWADFCMPVNAVMQCSAMHCCLACNRLHSAIGVAGGESRVRLLCVGGVGESRSCPLITAHKSAVTQHC